MPAHLTFTNVADSSLVKSFSSLQGRVEIGRGSRNSTDAQKLDCGKFRISGSAGNSAVMSVEHGVLTWENHEYPFFTDIGSTNGTTLASSSHTVHRGGNGLAAPMKPHLKYRLKDGDVITFGKTLAQCNPISLAVKILHLPDESSPFKFRDSAASSRRTDAIVLDDDNEDEDENPYPPSRQCTFSDSKSTHNSPARTTEVVQIYDDSDVDAESAPPAEVKRGYGLVDEDLLSDDESLAYVVEAATDRSDAGADRDDFSDAGLSPPPDVPDFVFEYRTEQENEASLFTEMGVADFLPPRVTFPDDEDSEGDADASEVLADLERQEREKEAAIPTQCRNSSPLVEYDDVPMRWRSLSPPAVEPPSPPRVSFEQFMVARNLDQKAKEQKPAEQQVPRLPSPDSSRSSHLSRSSSPVPVSTSKPVPAAVTLGAIRSFSSLFEDESELETTSQASHLPSPSTSPAAVVRDSSPDDDDLGSEMISDSEAEGATDWDDMVGDEVDEMEDLDLEEFDAECDFEDMELVDPEPVELELDLAVEPEVEEAVRDERQRQDAPAVEPFVDESVIEPATEVQLPADLPPRLPFRSPLSLKRPHSATIDFETSKTTSLTVNFHTETDPAVAFVPTSNALPVAVPAVPTETQTERELAPLPKRRKLSFGLKHLALSTALGFVAGTVVSVAGLSAFESMFEFVE